MLVVWCAVNAIKIIDHNFESINADGYVTYTLTPLLNACLMAGECTASIFPTTEYKS
jgi:hypothetical protein